MNEQTSQSSGGLQLLDYIPLDGKVPFDTGLELDLF
jgi:hypothetical protein